MGKIDFAEYDKPPFLPGWMSDGETLEVAKTINKQLEEINDSSEKVSDQYSDDELKNNTNLLDRRGRLLGVERQGSDNKTYYTIQELRKLLNINNSTVPDIIRILKVFYEGEAIRIKPVYPAGIKILHDGLAPERIDFNSVIVETIGAGISYETRELFIFKELLKIKDKITLLKHWNLDEVYYNGKLQYNGVGMYGGTHWEETLFDAKLNYDGWISEKDGKRIRTDEMIIDDVFILKNKPIDTDEDKISLKDSYTDKFLPNNNEGIGLDDVLSFTKTYYNYFDGTETYNGNIDYQPIIENI